MYIPARLVVAYHDGHRTPLKVYGKLTNANVRGVLAQSLGLPRLGDTAILWRKDGDKSWHTAPPPSSDLVECRKAGVWI